MASSTGQMSSRNRRYSVPSVYLRIWGVKVSRSKLCASTHPRTGISISPPELVELLLLLVIPHWITLSPQENSHVFDIAPNQPQSI